MSTNETAGAPEASEISRIRGLSGAVRARLRTAAVIAAAAILGLLTIGGGTVTATDKTVSNVVDGQQEQIWTVARTDQQALAQLGGSASDLPLSANRSRAIPLSGVAATAATSRTVLVSVAGASPVSTTTAATSVGELLAAQRISLGSRDTVSPALSTKLWDGLVIKVNRVVVSRLSTTVALPQPAAKTVTDASIVKGKSQVVQQGRAGRQLVGYTVTTVNGKQTAKVLTARKTVIAPVATITHVGTRTTFTYSGAEVFTNDTSFGVNWDGLANCESTHNPQAVNANPSAGLPTYGLFQFDLPTWASVGGSGNPMDASPEEQLMRAKLLFQQRGLSPWACAYAAH